MSEAAGRANVSDATGRAYASDAAGRAYAAAGRPDFCGVRRLITSLACSSSSSSRSVDAHGETFSTSGEV